MVKKRLRGSGSERGVDGCGTPGRQAHLRRRDRGGREVAEDLEHDDVGRRPDLGDRRVARIERVALAVRALQLHAEAEQVGDEQGVGLDQDRLARRLGLAQHRRAREQARRVAGLDGERFRRAGAGGVADVAPDHLHLVVDAPEFDDAAVFGEAAEEEALADAGLELGRDEERLVEVLGLELEQDPVVASARPSACRRCAAHRGRPRRTAAAGSAARPSAAPPAA